jgi:hypothetical protein
MYMYSLVIKKIPNQSGGSAHTPLFLMFVSCQDIWLNNFDIFTKWIEIYEKIILSQSPFYKS